MPACLCIHDAKVLCKWYIHNITFYSAESEQAPSSALYVCMSITVRLPGKFLMCLLATILYTMVCILFH